jgi:hypothetical protein
MKINHDPDVAVKAHAAWAALCRSHNIEAFRCGEPRNRVV